NRKKLSFGLPVAYISKDAIHPRTIRANVRSEGYFRRHHVVCTNFQSLLSPHNKADFPSRGILEKFYVTCASFLPFVGLFLKTKHFCTHLKELRFILFQSLGFHSFQFNNWGEMYIRSLLYIFSTITFSTFILSGSILPLLLCKFFVLCCTRS